MKTPQLPWIPRRPKRMPEPPAAAIEAATAEEPTPARMRCFRIGNHTALQPLDTVPDETIAGSNERKHWLDVEGSDRRQLDEALADYGLHPLHIDAFTDPGQVSRVVPVEGALFLEFSVLTGWEHDTLRSLTSFIENREPADGGCFASVLKLFESGHNPAAAALAWQCFFSLFTHALYNRHERDIRRAKRKWSFAGADHLLISSAPGRIIDVAREVGFIDEHTREELRERLAFTVRLLPPQPGEASDRELAAHIETLARIAAGLPSGSG